MDKIDERNHEHLIYHHSREDIPNLSQFYAHIHPKAEIYYLVEGQVEYHVEDRVYLLEPGDVMIMRPGEVHAAQVSTAAPYERFSLRFAPELLRDTKVDYLLSPFLDRSVSSSNHYSSEDICSTYIKACFDQIFSNGPIDSQERTLTYLLPILQEIYVAWDRQGNTQKIQTNPTFVKITSYINQHLSDIKSLQHLSDALYMSKSQLYRIFRTHAGLSAWDYVRAKQLFAAQELMKNGTVPRDAANECGFSEYTTFYRAYMKQYGHPPKDDYLK